MQLHGVVADRLDADDLHLLLAADGLALVRRVALHLGRGREYAQVLCRKGVALAVVEGDRKRPTVLRQPDLRGPGFRQFLLRRCGATASWNRASGRLDWLKARAAQAKRTNASSRSDGGDGPGDGPHGRSVRAGDHLPPRLGDRSLRLSLRLLH